MKWAGGKTQLLPKLLPLVPGFSGSYHEPFLGGGAVFFALHQRGLLDGKQVFLSDANAELVNTYVVLRDNVDDLIAALNVLKALPHGEMTYNAIRSQDPVALTDIERAARFIYLNKNCVNGIYRVNRQGVFNVPFNKGRRVSVPSSTLLRADSAALQGASITRADFRKSLQAVQPGDLVYADPPYDDVEFTSYTAGGFTRTNQTDLAAEVVRLSSIGAHVLLSKSDTEWVRERFAEFRQVPVMARRSVNSNGKGRGPVPELIIVGWQPAVPVVLPTAAAAVK